MAAPPAMARTEVKTSLQAFWSDLLPANKPPTAWKNTVITAIAYWRGHPYHLNDNMSRLQSAVRVCADK